MGDASNRLLELRPVTFHYRQAEEDGSRPLQYGLIAEDVAEVMPELAVYNEDGTPESVAYQVLPSLLLNEYQKQNRRLVVSEAELASAKSTLSRTEQRLQSVEAELAAMKAMLMTLASAQSAERMLASAP
jgi:hypothetical protein